MYHLIFHFNASNIFYLLRNLKKLKSRIKLDFLQLKKAVPVHREFSSVESAGNLERLMWEVWTRRPRRLGTVSHWNFLGVRCSTGMSAVVEWRPQNSSFSWISAFQCSRQTSEINATRIFHPKDYLKSTFQKFKSHMSSVSNSDKYYITMYLVHSGTIKIFY